MDRKNEFIAILEKLEKLMSQKGEFFRARAYSKARDALVLHKDPIVEKKIWLVLRE